MTQNIRLPGSDEPTLNDINVDYSNLLEDDEDDYLNTFFIDPLEVPPTPRKESIKLDTNILRVTRSGTYVETSITQSLSRTPSGHKRRRSSAISVVSPNKRTEVRSIKSPKRQAVPSGLCLPGRGRIVNTSQDHKLMVAAAENAVSRYTQANNNTPSKHSSSQPKNSGTPTIIYDIESRVWSGAQLENIDPALLTPEQNHQVQAFQNMRPTCATVVLYHQQMPSLALAHLAPVQSSIQIHRKPTRGRPPKRPRLAVLESPPEAEVSSSRSSLTPNNSEVGRLRMDEHGGLGMTEMERKYARFSRGEIFKLYDQSNINDLLYPTRLLPGRSVAAWIQRNPYASKVCYGGSDELYKTWCRYKHCEGAIATVNPKEASINQHLPNPAKLYAGVHQVVIDYGYVPDEDATFQYDPQGRQQYDNRNVLLDFECFFHIKCFEKLTCLPQLVRDSRVHVIVDERRLTPKYTLDRQYRHKPNKGRFVENKSNKAAIEHQYIERGIEWVERAKHHTDFNPHANCEYGLENILNFHKDVRKAKADSSAYCAVLPDLSNYRPTGPSDLAYPSPPPVPTEISIPPRDSIFYESEKCRLPFEEPQLDPGSCVDQTTFEQSTPQAHIIADSKYLRFQDQDDYGYDVDRSTGNVWPRSSGHFTWSSDRTQRTWWGPLNLRPFHPYYKQVDNPQDDIICDQQYSQELHQDITGQDQDQLPQLVLEHTPDDHWFT